MIEDYKEVMVKVRSAIKNKESQYIIVKKLEDNVFLYVEVSSGIDTSDFYFHVGIAKENQNRANNFVDTVQPSILELECIDKIPETLMSFENYFFKR